MEEALRMADWVRSGRKKGCGERRGGGGLQKDEEDGLKWGAV